MAQNYNIPRFIPGEGQSNFDLGSGMWASSNGLNVFVRCNDNTHMAMTIQHAINEKGLLSPSLRCPQGSDPEHFHIWATLEYWPFAAKPDTS